MYSFQYISPSTLEEALEFLRDHPDTCPLAGGTDVIVQYRAGKQKAPYVLNVLLPELTGVEEQEDCYRVGAATPLTDFADYFSALPQPFRMLARAAESVGSCQTRNLGTVGGNICTGNASADMATALLAAEAWGVAVGAGGERCFPLDRFFVKNRVIALEKGELLKDILIPKKPFPRVGAHFCKVGKRRGHVIATFNMAAVIGRDETDRIVEARLAGGTLAPTPLRFYESEKLLLGHRAGEAAWEETLEEVCRTMQTEICPRDSRRGSREYRMHASAAVLADAIRIACGREEEK